MDKRCKGCKYRAFEEADTKEQFAYCICKEKELRDAAKDWSNYIHRDAIRLRLRKKLVKFPEENLPSCMLVQAAFSELYHMQACPYFEEEK